MHMIHNFKIALLAGCLSACALASAEPIFYEARYPATTATSVPAVVALHSSGGYASVTGKVGAFVDAGYAVFTPDFFKKHGITTATRFDTWGIYRTDIEQELSELVQLMKKDPKVDPKNIFAVGYSNGGYWAAFLAAKGFVNAGVAHYGVWSFPNNVNGYPASYFSLTSHPMLALVGLNDQTQKSRFVLPQVERAQKLSPAVQLHTYEATHGWDCKVCNAEYVRNEEVTADALNRTLEFFKANTKK
jgi:dienelactone hydrolase